MNSLPDRRPDPFWRLVVVVVVVVAASAGRAAAPVVADANTARSLGELTTVAASSHRAFDVISSADVRRALELEANKQVAGCSTDATSCLAEVAGAMGARYVVFGSVSTLGSQLMLSLNLFDSTVASSAGRVVVKGGTVDELVGRIDGAVAELLGPAEQEAQQAQAGAVGPPQRVRVLMMDLEHGAALDAPPPPSSGWSTGTWMLLGGSSAAVVGVVVVGGGVVAGSQAQAADTAAKTERFQDEALRSYGERDLMSNVANVLFVGGAVLVVGGVAVGAAAPLFWE